MKKPLFQEASGFLAGRLDTQKLTKNGYENQGLKRNRLDADLVRERANGKWKTILTQTGINPSCLKNQHGPCPICGGNDRYRFDDKKGSGSSICNRCGFIGAFALVAWGLKLDLKKDFPQILAAVTDKLGIAPDNYHRKYKPRKTKPNPPKQPETNQQAVERIEKVWSESFILRHAQALAGRLYLKKRGLKEALSDLPGNVRFHPNLPYYNDGQFVGNFPALVFQIHNKDGRVVSLHRIYLDKSGMKATVPGSVKKLMSPIYEGALKGGAIRLYQPTGDTLGIAEGPETTLAIRAATGVAVWATISASLMPSIIIPQTIKNVQIWADLDRSGSGQAAAQKLARRLVAEGVEVRVMVPPGVILKGEKSVDWLDILNSEPVIHELHELHEHEIRKLNPPGKGYTHPPTKCMGP